MPVKPRSQRAAEQKRTASAADIERLATSIADRPYGQQSENTAKMAASEKAKPVAISLPPALIERLQDQALANKRSGSDLKTVSAIVRNALGKAGYEL
jgi:hypothetical protein